LHKIFIYLQCECNIEIKSLQMGTKDIFIEGNENIVIQSIISSTISIYKFDIGKIEADLEAIKTALGIPNVFNVLILCENPKKWKPYIGKADIGSLLGAYFEDLGINVSIHWLTGMGYLKEPENEIDFFDILSPLHLVVVDASVLKNVDYQNFICNHFNTGNTKGKPIFPLCIVPLEAKEYANEKPNLQKGFPNYLLLYDKKFRQGTSRFEPIVPTLQMFYRRMSNFFIDILGITFSTKTYGVSADIKNKIDDI
jgi:hypothetical protein